MIDHSWQDIHGDAGRLRSYPDDGIIHIGLDDGCALKGNGRAYAAHDLPIPTARALHEALGRALEDVDPQPAKETAR